MRHAQQNTRHMGYPRKVQCTTAAIKPKPRHVPNFRSQLSEKVRAAVDSYEVFFWNIDEGGTGPFLKTRFFDTGFVILAALTSTQKSAMPPPVLSKNLVTPGFSPTQRRDSSRG